MLFYLCFMYIFLHCIILICRLTVSFPPSLSQIWLLRNSKRWQLHMWMFLLRLGGFDGGILSTTWKQKISFFLLFLFTTKSSMTNFTKFFFRHIYSNTFPCFLFNLFQSLSFLTLCLSHLSWRKGLRTRSFHLKMNPPSTSTGLLRKIFYNLFILSSIGSSFCVARFFGCILMRREPWSSPKGSISWSSRKAQELSSALLTNNHLFFLFLISLFVFNFLLHFFILMFFNS